MTSEAINIFEGGLLYRLMVRLGLNGCTRRKIILRTLLWVMITWVPPFVLAAIDHLASPRSTVVGIFNDLPFHVRCLVALPILILAECPVGRNTSDVIPILLARGMIPPQAKETWIDVTAKIRRMRDSIEAELFLLIIGLAVVVSQIYIDLPQDVTSWRHTDSVLSTLAREWDRWVGLTIYYFMILRWTWRFLIWCNLIIRLALINPILQSHHPDLSGGLSFIVSRQLLFGTVAFALSAVISAKIGQIVLYGGVAVDTFLFPVIFYLATVEFMLVAPLLCFTPLLIVTRRSGIDRYGTFANRYAKDFDRKWLRSNPVQTQDELGTSDIQSLNDLGDSYIRQREMGAFAIHRKHIISLTVLISLPIMPLLLFKVPVTEFIKLVAKLIV